MNNEAENIKFDALRNAIYHTSRRSFFDSCTRVLNFVVVTAGASAVLNLGAYFGWEVGAFSAIAGGIAALAGLAQLVFDFSGQGRDHEFLQKRFYELLADVSETLDPKPKDIARWTATLNRLYGEERPPMRALDAIAYNAALESLGRNKAQRIPIKWWESFLRHFYAFNGTSFASRENA